MKIRVKDNATTPLQSYGFIALSAIATFCLVVGNFVTMPDNQSKMVVCVTQFFPNVNSTTVAGIMALIGIVAKFLHGELYTPRGMIGPNKPRRSSRQDIAASTEDVED